MIYEVMKIQRGDYTFRIMHDREHYDVWNGGIFVASADNIKEVMAEIKEYYERITGKNKG